MELKKKTSQILSKTFHRIKLLHKKRHVSLKIYFILNEHHAIKAYWGSGSIPPGPGRFNPRERTPGSHCIGGWVGPRAGLDTVVKKKISSH
jgi:hypothetical protein